MDCYDCQNQNISSKDCMEQNPSAYDIKNSLSGSIGQCQDKQFWQNYNCDFKHCDKKTSQCQYPLEDGSGQMGSYGFDYFFLNNNFNKSLPASTYSQIKLKFTMLCVHKYRENYQGSIGLGENLIDFGSQSFVAAIFRTKQDQYKKFTFCANKTFGFISFSGQPVLKESQLKIPYQRYYDYTYGIQINSIMISNQKQINVIDYKFIISSGFVKILAPRSFIEQFLAMLSLDINNQTMRINEQFINLPIVNFEIKDIGVFTWNPDSYVMVENDKMFLAIEQSQFENDVIFLGSKFMEEHRFQFDIHNCTNEKILSSDFIFQNIQFMEPFDIQIVIIFFSILGFFFIIFLIYKMIQYCRNRKVSLISKNKKSRSKKYEQEF